MPTYAIQPVTDFPVNQSYPVPGGAGDRFPDSVLLANGDFIVVWGTPGDPAVAAPKGIAIQRFNADGSADGAPVLFADGADPDIAAFPDGSYIVVWQSGIATGEYARFTSAGVMVGSPVSIGSPIFRPDIAVLSDGGWVVTWDDNADVYAQTFNAAGEPAPATLISTMPTGQHMHSAVIPLADGSYVVAWDENAFSNSGNRIWISHNGVASQIAEGTLMRLPQIELMPDGRLLVVWQNHAAEPTTIDNDIYFSFVNTNGTVTAPTLVNTGDQQLDQLDPQVGVFADGRFVIAWATADGSSASPFSINAQVFQSDGTPLPGAFLEHAEDDYSLDNQQMSLTILNGQEFMIAWVDETDSDTPQETRRMQGAIFSVETVADFVATPGPDTFDGSGLDDNVQGLGGDDSLHGGSGDDTLDGGADNDDLDGGTGDDTLIGGTGDDHMDGGTGSDTFHVDSLGDVVVDEGGSFDRILTSISYTLGSSLEIENLSALDQQGTGALNLTGNSGNQTIFGNDGANILHGGGGNDDLFGLGGNDVYYTDVAATTVTEGIGGGTDAIYTSVSYVLRPGQEIETLSTNDHAATSAINLTGNAVSQNVVGNAGNNVLHGGGGTDQLYGFGGNDVYYTDVATTKVFEATGAGNDALYTSVSYVLAGGQEVELLSVNSYAATSSINLTGNSFNQILVGNAGANILHGGGGTDQLYGQGGNDVYYTDVASTQVFENAGGGTDAVYTSVSYVLNGSSEVETLSANDWGAATALSLTGNSFAQTIVGNAGNNVFNGGGGADTLYGFGGNDVFYVDFASVQIVEAAGGGSDAIYTSVSYTLAGGAEVELLSTNSYAATGAINLTGNGFSNVVAGNAGANTLNGGAGADTLHGFGGADNFAFTTALGGGNVDLIADFVAADDTIQLDDAIFGGIGAPGAFSANAFVVGSAAADADDRIVYNQATGQLFYDADGNGAGAAVLFATLSGAPVLTASDFAVI
jgi:Ca2+-binding RTX toxin-like protein